MGLQKKGWKTYSHYGEDMQMSLDDFKREVTRWCHLWRLSEEGNPHNPWSKCWTIPVQNCTQEFM